MLRVKIEEFLHRKLKEHKLTKKEFAAQSGILYQSTLDILKSVKLNPSIVTITKIANYFDCSIDKVLDREKENLTNIRYEAINPDGVGENLRVCLESYIRIG